MKYRISLRGTVESMRKTLYRQKGWFTCFGAGSKMMCEREVCWQHIINSFHLPTKMIELPQGDAASRVVRLPMHQVQAPPNRLSY